MVAAEEAYSEVLQLEYEPREEDDEQPPVLQVATPNPVLHAAIMKTKDQHTEGDAPPHFPEQTSYSSHASSSLCLDNQEQYSRITHYMNSRGGYAYLMALFSPNMCRDEQVLCLCSMLWQIGLTVASAENLTQIKFRHKSMLERTDGVLVMCLGQHYIPACKYSIFVPPDGCILQLDGCSVHPDGCILPPDRFIITYSHCARTVAYCHRMGV